MTQAESFWDASALIPLCTRQPTTDAVHRLATQYSHVVWWASVVEVHSGIARLHRMGEIDGLGKQQALRALLTLRQSWIEIHPSEIAREKASTALDTYPLRAADSLQLAAALIWYNDQPTGCTFISSDIRLCEAAIQSGFTVLTP